MGRSKAASGAVRWADGWCVGSDGERRRRARHGMRCTCTCTYRCKQAALPTDLRRGKRSGRHQTRCCAAATGPSGGTPARRRCAGRGGAQRSGGRGGCWGNTSPPQPAACNQPQLFVAVVPGQTQPCCIQRSLQPPTSFCWSSPRQQGVVSRQGHPAAPGAVCSYPPTHPPTQQPTQQPAHRGSRESLEARATSLRWRSTGSWQMASARGGASSTVPSRSAVDVGATFGGGVEMRAQKCALGRLHCRSGKRSHTVEHPSPGLTQDQVLGIHEAEAVHTLLHKGRRKAGKTDHGEGVWRVRRPAAWQRATHHQHRRRSAAVPARAPCCQAPRTPAQWRSTRSR